MHDGDRFSVHRGGWRTFLWIIFGLEYIEGPWIGRYRVSTYLARSPVERPTGPRRLDKIHQTYYCLGKVLTEGGGVANSDDAG